MRSGWSEQSDCCLGAGCEAGLVVQGSASVTECGCSPSRGEQVVAGGVNLCSDPAGDGVGMCEVADGATRLGHIEFADDAPFVGLGRDGDIADDEPAALFACCDSFGLREVARAFWGWEVEPSAGSLASVRGQGGVKPAASVRLVRIVLVLAEPMVRANDEGREVEVFRGLAKRLIGPVLRRSRLPGQRANSAFTTSA